MQFGPTRSYTSQARIFDVGTINAAMIKYR
jgi:hypothetical protein